MRGRTRRNLVDRIHAVVWYLSIGIVLFFTVNTAMVAIVAWRGMVQEEEPPQQQMQHTSGGGIPNSTPKRSKRLDLNVGDDDVRGAIGRVGSESTNFSVTQPPPFYYRGVFSGRPVRHQHWHNGDDHETNPFNSSSVANN